MEHLSSLLAVSLVSILAAVSPGPDFFIVLRNSLSYSRKCGFFTTFGIAAALVIHLSYTLIGIGVLIAESDFLYHLIKYAGAAYLFYIGFIGVISSLKKSSKINVTEKQNLHQISPFTAFKQGFFTNLLNPKAAIFFISLFSQFIGPETPISLKLAYAAINLTIGLVWFLFLSFLVTGEKFVSKVNRFQIYIDRVMGSALMVLSVKLLLV